MAERPDEHELDDYPERRHGEDDTNRPTSYEEEKFFQENSLREETYKSFRARQQLIESNRVGVRTSFLDGRKKEIKILKRNILSDILKIPYDEVETKFELKIEPVDIETFKLYYKNRPLIEYNAKYDRITILSEDNLNLFKTKYVNETIDRYVKKEMRSDFSIKSDLSVIDLEVRQAESEKYHRELNRLQTKVSELENEKRSLEGQANQRIRDLQDQLQRARQQAANIGGYDHRNEIIRNLEQELAHTRDQIFEISSNKDRRIGGLMDQINRMKEEANDEIEALNESLQIKSTQIIENQREIELSREKIEDLENEIKSNKTKNLNELETILNKERERYEKEINELRKQRVAHQNEKEELGKKLVETIDERQKDIIDSIKKINEAHDERTKSILIQESLQDKIIELEKAVKKYEDLYASEKSINEDKELELDKARKEIDELRKESMEEIDRYNRIRNTHKEKIDALKNTIKINEEHVESQRNTLEERKKYYEDIIEKNRVEIGSLRFEKRALEETAANLNREIQQSENTNEVLTTQLDRVNTEIIGLNERIQEIQTENQTLTIELDTLRSNFGNLVASLEVTNKNNTQEILKLNNEIKRLESETDSIETYVNGLVESIDNYKHLLDDAVEDKKKLKKKFEEEFDKLNKEKESLVQDLKNKSKNEEDLMKKLWQNENNYSLLTQRFEKSFLNIYDLTLELDKTSEREKILEAELEQRESRIKVKDEEVTEKMVEIKKLKKQIEDSNFNIKNSDFYEQQYTRTKIKLDKTISERNKYIQDLNRARGDNDELEQDIEVLEKEIEVLKKDRDLAKSKIIPKETVDQMKHDNQELNKQLNVREKQLKEVVEKYRIVKNEHDMAMNNFNKLKKTINKRIDSIKKSYEKELEISRKKLAKTISPGELKALNVFLEDLDIEDYDKVDYDTQIKKLRSAREKFKRLIDDPSTDRAHRLQYKYLDDLMQYGIEFLNIEFKKPIETIKGRDYLIRADNSWSPLGMVKKILLAMKDNPGTTMSLALTAVSNLAFGIFYLVSTSASYSKKSVVNTGKNIIKITKIEPPSQKVKPIQKIEPPSQKVKPIQKIEPPSQKVKPIQKIEPPSQKVKPIQKIEPQKVKPSQKVKPTKDKTGDVVAGGSILYNIISSIPSYVLSFIEKAINFIDWFVENFYKLILAGVIVSVTLYNKYGEEMSFPILSFWSFALAIAIVSMTTLTGFLPSWITG